MTAADLSHLGEYRDVEAMLRRISFLEAENTKLRDDISDKDDQYAAEKLRADAAERKLAASTYPTGLDILPRAARLAV